MHPDSVLQRAVGNAPAAGNGVLHNAKASTALATVSGEQHFRDTRVSGHWRKAGKAEMFVLTRKSGYPPMVYLFLPDEVSVWDCRNPASLSTKPRQFDP